MTKSTLEKNSKIPKQQSPFKGRKNKRRGHKESDWKTYWGSSDLLQEDVQNSGEDNPNGNYTFVNPEV